MGKRLYFLKADIDEWLEKNRVKKKVSFE